MVHKKPTTVKTNRKPVLEVNMKAINTSPKAGYQARIDLNLSKFICFCISEV